MHGLLSVCAHADALPSSSPCCHVLPLCALLSCAVLQNGVHFTTPRLTSLSAEHLQLDAQYRQQQSAVVQSCVETVQTYLPVVEACSLLVHTTSTSTTTSTLFSFYLIVIPPLPPSQIAELDVLTSFASVAALAPNPYCRPVLHPLDTATDKEAGTDTATSTGTAAAASAPPPRALTLRKARHPCVELMDCMDFIANDYDLVGAASSFQLITGWVGGWVESSTNNVIVCNVM